MPEYEFIVEGEPTSINTKGQGRHQKKKRDIWQDRVAEAVRQAFPASATLLPVEVSISTYFTALARDVDNVIKDILDSMKGLAYKDDKQVYKVTSERFDLKAPDFAEATPTGILAAYLPNSPEFVHIRVLWQEEDALR